MTTIGNGCREKTKKFELFSDKFELFQISFEYRNIINIRFKIQTKNKKKRLFELLNNNKKLLNHCVFLIIIG